jgi:phosphate transport system substrate-binding protein
MSKRLWGLCVIVGALVTGCGSPAAGRKDLSGEIKCDGSSTVYLITQAAATEFKKLHPGVNISVGISGTGGGFKKFAAGETDVQDASRKIKDAEAARCKENNVAYTELQVAWDGLAVVINKDNDWASKMTVEQLRKIWHPDSAARKWSDVDPGWPNEPIKLYGAGTDSGTFDYFTEAVNGKEKVSRTDYEASEDDNVVVRGVSLNKYALGYFGVAYYEANKDKLQVVRVAARAGAPYVEPTPANVLSRKYTPLSRPLFIYARTASLRRPQVREFVNFYMRRLDLAPQVGYVQLSARQLFAEREKLTAALKSVGQ